MMKRVFLILLVVLATSVTLFDEALAADEAQSNPSPPEYGYVWPWYPWVRKVGPPNVAPPPGADVSKCLESFVATQLNCLPEILSALLGQNVVAGEPCCVAIQAAHADCLNTAFQHYDRPLLLPALKDQCLKKDGGAAPPKKA